MVIYCAIKQVSNMVAIYCVKMFNVVLTYRHDWYIRQSKNVDISGIK